ncbi:hypothetical protein HPB48_018914 [Haemaphysalis longicornis]|uniref:Uncharacterized protein n=1 Tax=Haemaphysalis longicornis TaxID=44386 RepID=A0A9J6G1I0_HAELO|nr:hypothetical protein HPB48_018914 [Haemaphysalis longicornis]
MFVLSLLSALSKLEKEEKRTTKLEQGLDCTPDDKENTVSSYLETSSHAPLKKEIVDITEVEDKCPDIIPPRNHGIGSDYSDIEMKYVETHITDRGPAYENGTEKRYPETFAATLGPSVYITKQREDDLTYAELSLPPSSHSTFSRSRPVCRAAVGSPAPSLSGPHEPPTEYADIDFAATRAHGRPPPPSLTTAPPPSPPSHGGRGWVPPRTSFDSWPKYTPEPPRSPLPASFLSKASGTLEGNHAGIRFLFPATAPGLFHPRSSGPVAGRVDIKRPPSPLPFRLLFAAEVRH